MERIKSSTLTYPWLFYVWLVTRANVVNIFQFPQNIATASSLMWSSVKKKIRTTRACACMKTFALSTTHHCRRRRSQQRRKVFFPFPEKKHTFYMNFSLNKNSVCRNINLCLLCHPEKHSVSVSNSLHTPSRSSIDFLFLFFGWIKSPHTIDGSQSKQWQGAAARRSEKSLQKIKIDGFRTFETTTLCGGGSTNIIKLRRLRAEGKHIAKSNKRDFFSRMSTTTTKMMRWESERE